MPRPKNGYTNAAGQQVPAVGQVINRFDDKKLLMARANQQGLKGIDINRDRSALDIGSTVHGMVELDMKKASDREIYVYCCESLKNVREHIELATASFRAYRDWKSQRVRMLHQERSLVSESLQYGGTIDLICVINDGIGLIDFKSSNGLKGPFMGQQVQLAAYANLWNECHPLQELDDCHLLILSKDGAGFRHCTWRLGRESELDRQWRMFKVWRQAYELENGGSPQPRARAAPQSATKIKEPLRAGNDNTASIETPKPRVRVEVTMPEVLRAVDKHEADRIWSRPIISTVGQKPPHGLFGGAL
jgi:hypothetical protein